MYNYYQLAVQMISLKIKLTIVINDKNSNCKQNNSSSNSLVENEGFTCFFSDKTFQ